jgi:hypothetical protein
MVNEVQSRSTPGPVAVQADLNHGDNIGRTSTFPLRG